MSKNWIRWEKLENKQACPKFKTVEDIYEQEIKSIWLGPRLRSLRSHVSTCEHPEPESCTCTPCTPYPCVGVFEKIIQTCWNFELGLLAVRTVSEKVLNPLLYMNEILLYIYHDILTIYDINILHHIVIFISDNSDNIHKNLISKIILLELQLKTNTAVSESSRVCIQTFDW